MKTWQKVWPWIRGILATFGAMGCLLVLLVAGMVLSGPIFAGPDQQEPKSPPDELAGAADLLNEAGLERKSLSLELVASDPWEWQSEDGSIVQLWCLRAPNLPSGARWVRTQDLEPGFALAVMSTLDAAHGVHACVPEWRTVYELQWELQPMQLIYSQRQLSYARLAVYDRTQGMLYLVSRSTPTSPPAEVAVTPSAPEPSTE